MTIEWGILSEDGQFYAVGRWENGLYFPGSLADAIRECKLLKETEPLASVTSRKMDPDKWQLSVAWVPR